MKKIVMLALISVLLLSLFLPRLMVPVSAVKEHWKKDGLPGVELATVDPAWCYDTASGELVSNVYDTLVRYDRESVVDFGEILCDFPDPHNWMCVYACRCVCATTREDVRFHDGSILTSEDVEYSFERLMVEDPDGGPQWMVYEQLLDCYEANMSDPDWMEIVDAAVESNATHVWFNFAKPYNPTIFLQILTMPFCSILSKDWAIAQGCWDGEYTMESLEKYHRPAISPLMDPEPVMMGTGPYKFDYWEKGKEWSIVKNDDYWQGWPAPGCRGFVERITTKFGDWETIKKEFFEGDAAIIDVPRKYISEMYPIPEGIECDYPLPVLMCEAMLFKFNISATSPYIGSGKLDGEGIPSDFFSDVDVRKAFAYSLNYSRYLLEAYHGEAIHPATCVVEGLPYRNPEQKGYDFNLTKAEEHFRMAWEGQLWEGGFKMTIAYNKGNEPRRIASEMLKSSIESLNPKFHIDIVELDWATYLTKKANQELPIYITGHLADYPHPYNFLHTFMHSQGAFASWQGYKNSTVDEYIEALRGPIDEDELETWCAELQNTYHNECISVSLAQPCTRHWHKSWVQGYYYNPAYYGDYFYHLWPEELPPGDINRDANVDIYDAILLAGAYNSKPNSPNWNAKADINNDGTVDIYDAIILASNYGRT